VFEFLIPIFPVLCRFGDFLRLCSLCQVTPDPSFRLFGNCLLKRWTPFLQKGIDLAVGWRSDDLVSQKRDWEGQRATERWWWQLGRGWVKSGFQGGTHSSYGGVESATYSQSMRERECSPFGNIIFEVKWSKVNRKRLILNPFRFRELGCTCPVSTFPSLSPLTLRLLPIASSLLNSTDHSQPQPILPPLLSLSPPSPSSSPLPQNNKMVSKFSLSPFDVPSPVLAHFNRIAGSTSGQDKIFMVYACLSPLFLSPFSLLLLLSEWSWMNRCRSCCSCCIEES